MMHCIGYGKKGVKQGKSCADAAKMPNIWIDVEAPTKKELEELRKRFGLHAMSIEESVASDHRPKLEHFGEHAFMIVKTLDYNKREKVHAKHVGIFFGKGFLITVHPEKLTEFDHVKKQLELSNTRILSEGTDYLLYLILEGIVDDYLHELDRMEDELEALEVAATGSPSRKFLEKVFRMKKANIAIRKTLWAEREVITGLEGGIVQFMPKRNAVYFRSVNDHLFETIDMNEAQRDIVTGILDVYLSSLQVSLNEVMKTLTIISAFILIPTLIAGIYGMNFAQVPEYHWDIGYWWALALMLGSSAVLYFWFRKKGWL